MQKKHHIVIRGALLDAVRDGIITVNFSDYIEFPKTAKFEGKAYTEEQVAILFRALESEKEPIRSAITLAVCYGLRRSEVCGLRWQDINFENSQMHIQNTVTKNGSLRIEAEETKTAKSNRTIYPLDSTVLYLKELKQHHESLGIPLGKVCAWPDGTPVEPDYITRTSRKVLKKHGLEHIRFHDFRHTAGSLAARRATPKQVQDFLGHEDISTTMNTYVHAGDADKKAIAAIMNDMVKDTLLCSEKCSEC